MPTPTVYLNVGTTHPLRQQFRFPRTQQSSYNNWLADSTLFVTATDTAIGVRNANVDSTTTITATDTAVGLRNANVNSTIGVTATDPAVASYGAVASTLQTITATDTALITWQARAFVLQQTATATLTADTVETFNNWFADSTLSVTATDTGTVKWATTTSAAQAVTATTVALTTWALKAKAPLVITVTIPTTNRGVSADSTLSLATTFATVGAWATSADAVLGVDTGTLVVPLQAFVNYTLVNNMPNSHCIGSGRRFKGSVFGQDNYAYCPHCKTTSNRLGQPGITADLASGSKFVVPIHVDPSLVELTQTDASQLVSVYRTAQLQWTTSAGVAQTISVAPTVNRQVPDWYADATLPVTAAATAAGTWTTTANATLPVTATATAIVKWVTQISTALLTNATTTADGPNKWRADATMPITMFSFGIHS
jgi:hypothetical protein